MACAQFSIFRSPVIPSFKGIYKGKTLPEHFPLQSWAETYGKTMIPKLREMVAAHMFFGADFENNPQWFRDIRSMAVYMFGTDPGLEEIAAIRSGGNILNIAYCRLDMLDAQVADSIREWGTAKPALISKRDTLGNLVAERENLEKEYEDYCRTRPPIHDPLRFRSDVLQFIEDVNYAERNTIDSDEIEDKIEDYILSKLEGIVVENVLPVQDPEIVASMTDEQKDEYKTRLGSWERNHPWNKEHDRLLRGLTANELKIVSLLKIHDFNKEERTYTTGTNTSSSQASKVVFPCDELEALLMRNPCIRIWINSPNILDGGFLASMDDRSCIWELRDFETEDERLEMEEDIEQTVRILKLQKFAKDPYGIPTQVCRIYVEQWNGIETPRSLKELRVI